MNLKNNYLLKHSWSGPIILIFNYREFQYLCCIFFKKRKNSDIILHLCTKHFEKIYSSWDIAYDRLKLVIMGHFWPLNLLDISSFYTCVPKIMIIWCMLPEIWSATHNFLSFVSIFCPLTLLTIHKIKLK